MESFKFQLNIEENEEIKDNDTSIKLDNELKVISKKRNVTIYLNSKTNPASIIKEIKKLESRCDCFRVLIIRYMEIVKTVQGTKSSWRNLNPLWKQ